MAQVVLALGVTGIQLLKEQHGIVTDEPESGIASNGTKDLAVVFVGVIVQIEVVTFKIIGRFKIDEGLCILNYET